MSDMLIRETVERRPAGFDLQPATRAWPRRNATLRRLAPSEFLHP